MEPSAGPEVGDHEALVAGGAVVCFLSQLTKVRVSAQTTIERYTFIAEYSSPRPKRGCSGTNQGPAARAGRSLACSQTGGFAREEVALGTARSLPAASHVPFSSTRREDGAGPRQTSGRRPRSGTPAAQARKAYFIAVPPSL